MTYTIGPYPYHALEIIFFKLLLITLLHATCLSPPPPPKILDSPVDDRCTYVDNEHVQVEKGVPAVLAG